jgi:hypothetical protein
MPAKGNVNLIYRALGKKRASHPGSHPSPGQEKGGPGRKTATPRKWFLILKKSCFFLTGKTTSFYKSSLISGDPGEDGATIC